MRNSSKGKCQQIELQWDLPDVEGRGDGRPAQGDPEHKRRKAQAAKRTNGPRVNGFALNPLRLFGRRGASSTQNLILMNHQKNHQRTICDIYIYVLFIHIYMYIYIYCECQLSASIRTGSSDSLAGQSMPVQLSRLREP
jgi:hypothetical protein